MRRDRVFPEVDAGKCAGCGLCVRACPSYVLDMQDHRAAVARGDWCIGCGHCWAVCPVEAVAHPLATVEDVHQLTLEPAASPETLQRLLRERRSVRIYEERPIPRAVLERVLEAGRYAPTGTNSQNVRYVVLTTPAEIVSLRDRVVSFYEKLFKRVGSRAGGLLIRLLAGRETLEYLRGYLPMAEHVRGLPLEEVDPVLHHAPAVMLVHAEAWDPCSGFNCAVALYNCSLMAHALGVGCCFNGFVEGAVNNGRRIKKGLGIPKAHRCFGAMTLGYPDVAYRRLVERARPQVQWR